jgi:hypothetical protein
VSPLPSSLASTPSSPPCRHHPIEESDEQDRADDRSSSSSTSSSTSSTSKNDKYRRHDEERGLGRGCWRVDSADARPQQLQLVVDREAQLCHTDERRRVRMCQSVITQHPGYSPMHTSHALRTQRRFARRSTERRLVGIDATGGPRTWRRYTRAAATHWVVPVEAATPPPPPTAEHPLTYIVHSSFWWRLCGGCMHGCGGSRSERWWVRGLAI